TVMRHLFGSPISISFTLVESYLLVMSLALGLPWGYRTGAWISVTFLSDRLSEQNKHIIFRLGCLIAFPYVLSLFWFSAIETYDLFVNNEHMFGIISWPLGWSWIWVPMGLGVLT